MKRLILFIVVAFATIACSKIENSPSDTKIMTIEAGIPQVTKTSLNLSSYEMTWDNGDGITICNGSQYADYSMSELSESKKIAKFDGQDLGSGNLLAVYGNIVGKQGSRIDYNIPAIQEYVPNGIKNGYIPMCGIGGVGDPIDFEYQAGVLSFSLYSTNNVTIKSIKLIKTQYSGTLAGDFAACRNADGSFSIVPFDGNIYTIEIMLPTEGVVLGSSVENATNFNFVISGGSSTYGMSVIIADENNDIMVLNPKTTNIITAGTILKYKAKEYVGEEQDVFVSDGINMLPIGLITSFSPSVPNQEYTITSNRDNNVITSDEISLIKSWTVTLKKQVVLNFTDISVANNKWKDPFWNVSCIKFPKTVTSIASSGNISLSSVVWPDNLLRLEESAFDGSNNLEIELPSTVNYVGGAAVNVCKSLSVNTSNPYFHYSNGGLYYESGQTKKFVAYIVGSGIEDLVIENNTNVIETYAFCHANGVLKSIDMPETVSSMGRLVFFDTKSIHTITCRATSAPISSNSPFMNGSNISGSYYSNKEGTAVTHPLMIYVPSGATGYDSIIPWNGLTGRSDIFKYTLVSGDLSQSTSASIKKVDKTTIPSSGNYWD